MTPWQSLVFNPVLTLAGPTPTNISWNSEPLTVMKGTLASPAVALASKVFPVPGGPDNTAPWGMRGHLMINVNDLQRALTLKLFFNPILLFLSSTINPNYQLRTNLGNLGSQFLVLLRVLQEVDKLQYLQLGFLTACDIRESNIDVVCYELGFGLTHTEGVSSPPASTWLCHWSVTCCKN